MKVFIKSSVRVNMPFFPGCIILCQFDISAWDDVLFTRENIFLPMSIQTSVSKRRAHYFAGRVAAKSALSKIGIENFILLNGKHMEPLWPRNIVGSLSHSEKFAACAVHRSFRSSGVGIDVESVLSRESARDILDLVVGDRENELIYNSIFDCTMMLTLIFSAKESLFKALYPHVRYYFDFDVASVVAVDFFNKTFTLMLTRSLTPELLVGDIFTGYFRFIESEVITFIYFNHGPC
ncbi:4'-phosphopantetheinyl transferase superfamily protein [Salmonella enterica]|nr:4'-phosphopantetheinyl transferase superfamily protein [Salmonella enterica]